MKKMRLTMLATIAAIFVAVALAEVAWARPTPDGTDEYQAQVVGGTPVADGEYRFMASLQYDRENTTPRQDHFCGGTLISPYHVMTAAHCAAVIGEGQDQFVPLEDLRVVVGGATLNGDDGRVRRISRPSHVRIHPRYDEQSENFAHDVAVLQLNRPVRGIEPIRLATTGTDALERPGRLAIVTGWGNTIAQPVGPGAGLGLFDGPNRMREAQVPIVSDDECATVYGAEYFRGLRSARAGPTWTPARATRADRCSWRCPEALGRSASPASVPDAGRSASPGCTHK